MIRNTESFAATVKIVVADQELELRGRKAERESIQTGIQGMLRWARYMSTRDQDYSQIPT